MARFARIALVLAASALVLATSLPVARAQATEPAVVLLRDARDARVRVQAATALGSGRSPAVVQHLIRALDADVEATVRAACATALASFHTSQARGALRRAQSDPSSLVR